VIPARRVGILGGTFDPIHRGHADLGRAVESALGLTEIIVLPASVPPHRPPPVASAFHRFAMASLAALERPRWRASDRELTRPAPSFTTDTFALFRADGYRPSELCFIVGADAFAAIDTWRDYPAILDAAHFAVVSRPGHPVVEIGRRLPALAARMARPTPGFTSEETRVFLIDAETTDVSATAIRARCAAGQSISGLVSRAVMEHIARHGLYSRAPVAHRDVDPRPNDPAGRLHGQD
jgi:nicotinate-nucleotide adenylyltransferase